MYTTNYSPETAYQLEDGKIAAFEYDHSPSSPRRDWDNLGFLALKSHAGDEGCPYELGLLVAYSQGYTPEEAAEASYVEADVAEVKSAFAEFKRELAIVLPVYRYEHSAVAYNTTGFNDRWDSGQAGVIYATKAAVRQCYGVKRITDGVLEKAKSCLVGEVETFSQWANGDVYGIKLYADQEAYEKGEEEDSCWGFYFSEGYDFDKAVADHFRSEIVESERYTPPLRQPSPQEVYQERLNAFLESLEEVA